ncbi:hypothetical protein AAF712_000613, partial [Marasmius tenuissimus]
STNHNHSQAQAISTNNTLASTHPNFTNANTTSILPIHRYPIGMWATYKRIEPPIHSSDHTVEKYDGNAATLLERRVPPTNGPPSFRKRAP